MLITGANRGLGYALVKDLVKNKYPKNLYMGCRDTMKGKEALNQLDTHNLKTNVEVVHLDLNDPQSFKNVKNHLREDNKLSVVLNNAAILYQGNKFDIPKITEMLNINYVNQKRLINSLLDWDLLEHNSKIINTTSSIGKSIYIQNKDIRKKVEEAQTYQDIDGLKNIFLDAVKKEEFWFNPKAVHPFYIFSKYLYSKYTFALSKDERIRERGIEVYAVCPGWVRTDMGGEMASLSLEEGIQPYKHLINKETGVDTENQGKLFTANRFMLIK